MLTPVCLYVTAKDRNEAVAIGRALVKKRLAACANVFDAVQSIYQWNGSVQDDSEVVLIAKTRDSLVPAAIELVRSLHSYDCPCVVAWPLAHGNPDYLAWIERETRSD